MWRGIPAQRRKQDLFQLSGPRARQKAAQSETELSGKTGCGPSQSKLNKEIASELHLTEGTIKECLHRIFRKLGTKNRTELAVFALTHLTGQRDKHVA